MFAQAYDSSDSDYSDEPSNNVVQQTNFKLMSSESEDEVRVVRSAKDKLQTQLKIIQKNFLNHRKIKDNAQLMNDFEEVMDLYEKNKKAPEFDYLNKFFIRSLVEMDDYVKASWENKKDLNKVASKALNVLRQKIKKITRDFEEQIEDCNKNPEAYKCESEEEKEEEDEEEDDDSEIEDLDPINLKDAEKIKDDESSDTFSSDSDDSSSTDSSIDPLNLNTYKNPADYFLQVNVDAREALKRKNQFVKGKKPNKLRERQPKADVSDEEEEVHESKLQAFEKNSEVTLEMVVKKMEEVMIDRGRQVISINDQLSLLSQIETKIHENNFGIGVDVKCLVNRITVLFDYETKNILYMPDVRFKKAVELFNRLLDIMENNRGLITLHMDFQEFDEELKTPPYKVQCSIPLFVLTLDTEYTKILQNINIHEIEYVERLRDEKLVVDLLDRLCPYMESIEASPSDMCAIYLRKVEHMYYKFDFAWAKSLPEEVDSQFGCDDNLHKSSAPEHPSVKEMRQLCEYIYTHDTTDRLRTRAILCHIYHFALYGYWFRARDLMLMSNLQASIDHADQSTMVLYNRAIVQLSLCAFRQGHMKEAHNALVDIIGSQHVRELLAQQISNQNRYYEKNSEEEKRERSIQVPYHMHINTDLLECVFLVSTMLLEIPMLAAHESDMKWRVLSKTFHQALRIHDRAALNAPPESPREHVINAAKSMRVGNWKASLDYLINLKMDSKIWNLFFHADSIKKMLTQQVKEESLRSYLFMYSSVHDSISLDRLAEQFELPKSMVYSLISKMIHNNELAGTLEVPSDFIIMHKTERSRLQTLALQLADKVNLIADMNEKIIENRNNPNYNNMKMRRTNNRQNPSVKFNLQ